MKVNFNNLRKQALHRHDDLVQKLNRAIIRNDDNWAVPNDMLDGQQINLKGYVVLAAEDIQETMNDLRMLIGAIASCYEPGDDECKDVYSEAYPEDSDETMEVFNSEP